MLSLNIKLIVFYIFLIDSMIGILFQSNDLTNYMILLTSLITPITLLTSKNKIMQNNLFLLGIILIIAFSTSNLLIWYLSYETVIIPMIYILSKGSSSIYSRSRAIYRFTIYTILGGLLLLIGILVLLNLIGSLNYWSYLLNNSISSYLQFYLFPMIFLSYIIKLPILPFHIWLPDTHGEAPTSGSVILAALLLKLGGVGLIRWLIPILPIGFNYYKPLILVLGVLSSIYASITTLRHIDLKKLIAYSSIAHMGFILIGLSSFSSISLKGVILLLFSHGLVSSLLFLLIGSLYVRTSTRYIYYYKGLTTTMPIFSIFLFLALLLNAALPPSLPFVAEFLILQGTFSYEIIGVFNTLLAVLFSGLYSIWLFCKLAFSVSSVIPARDITLREFYILFPLLSLSIIFSFLY